jgi:hypothetical protein
VRGKGEGDGWVRFYYDEKGRGTNQAENLWNEWKGVPLEGT